MLKKHILKSKLSNLRVNIKVLAVTLSVAILVGPVAATELKRIPQVNAATATTVPIALRSSVLDDFSWQKNSDGYWVNCNQDLHSTRSELTSEPFNVYAGATAEIKFDWEISSEQDYDELVLEVFSVDVTGQLVFIGAEPVKISGNETEMGKTVRFTNDTDEEKKFCCVFTYIKDFSINAGEDTARVGNLTVNDSTVGLTSAWDKSSQSNIGKWSNDGGTEWYLEGDRAMLASEPIKVDSYSELNLKYKVTDDKLMIYGMLYNEDTGEIVRIVAHGLNKMSDYETVKVPLDKGTYGMRIVGMNIGEKNDVMKGKEAAEIFVKDVTMTTYSDLTEIPKTAFAKPSDLGTTLDHGENQIIPDTGTYQYIYWGSYPQSFHSAVLAEDSTSEPAGTTETGASDFSEDGQGKQPWTPYYYDGTNYTKIYRDVSGTGDSKYKAFFNNDPIKFRILENNTAGKQLYLFSEKVLDTRINQNKSEMLKGREDGSADISKWLTGTFLSNAFTEGQQARMIAEAIPYDTVAITINSEDNTQTLTFTSTTLDKEKVWLPSIFNGKHKPITAKADDDLVELMNKLSADSNGDLTNTKYGFVAIGGPRGERILRVSDYTIMSGGVMASIPNVGDISKPFANSFTVSNVSDSENGKMNFPVYFGGLRMQLSGDANIAPALKVDGAELAFAAAVAPNITRADTDNVPLTGTGDGELARISTVDGMYLRFTDTNNTTEKVTVQDNNATLKVTGAKEGERLVIQGITQDGKSWAYTAPVTSTGDFTVTVDEVTAANKGAIDRFELTTFTGTKAWLERENDGVVYASALLEAADIVKLSKTGDDTIYITIGIGLALLGAVALAIKAIRKRDSE